MAGIKIVSLFRPLKASQHSATRTTSFAFQKHRYYAGQSYGGGQGDPKGETPQEQGANPSAEQEHPGPPPPKAGQGSGGGPTKAGADGHNTQDGPSKGSSSNSNKSGASQSSGGPQPKILSDNTPTEESDEVKAHNNDMGNRHDRANTEVDEKGETVEKGFWKVLQSLWAFFASVRG